MPVSSVRYLAVATRARYNFRFFDQKFLPERKETATHIGNLFPEDSGVHNPRCPGAPVQIKQKSYLTPRTIKGFTEGIRAERQLVVENEGLHSKGRTKKSRESVVQRPTANERKTKKSLRFSFFAVGRCTTESFRFTRK